VDATGLHQEEAALNEIKRAIRDLTTRGKEAGREVDGHSASDDAGNAGDRARMHTANARDELDRAAHTGRDRVEHEAHGEKVTRKSR
jgi:hypothetical protein